MSIKLIDNNIRKHRKYLNKILESPKEIFILIAFLKENALDNYLHILEKHISNDISINIIVGLDLYVTDPNALYKIYHIVKNHKKSNFMLYSSNKGTFHPKIYASNGKGKSQIIIGSANFTNGGLNNNVEASVYYKTKNKSLYKHIEEMFITLSKDSNCSNASLLNISQYHKKHSIFTEKSNQADNEAKEHIDNIFLQNLEEIKDYLEEYYKDSDGFGTWENRSDNYVEAKDILDEMLETDFQNSEEFLEYYGLLVGAAGEGQLWHSGSINRSKTIVSEQYELFLEMLSELKENIDSTPSEIFNICQQYVLKDSYKKIHGIGYNVVTEILATYAPIKFPVLNKNPLDSIEFLGFQGFKNPPSFNSDDYQNYSNFMSEFSKEVGFDNLLQVDHFLNYIYWAYTR